MIGHRALGIANASSGGSPRDAWRPDLAAWDRAFWNRPRRLWPRWSGVLDIVQPETVVARQLAGASPQVRL